MKLLNKVKNFKFILLFVVVLLLGGIIYKNNEVILSFVNKVFFANGKTYTEEIPSITIQTDDYGEPGSFKITKSAKWTDVDEAEIHFEVDTEPMYGQGGKVDVLLVFDISGSMIDDKLDKVKEDSKEFIQELTAGNTSVGIITFNNNAQIESNFTTDTDYLLDVVDNLKISGGTSYTNAFNKIDELLANKTNPDRVVKILFLTDGIPNDDSFTSKYELLKEKYPIILSSIQYRMGETDYNELKDLSDYFYNSKEATKENILVNAFYGPELKLYDNFVITDFIDNDNFIVESINDIKVTDGKVNLKNVDGQQQIVWDFSNKYISGQIEEMTIKVKLKDNKSGEAGFYPTNTHEIISYSIENKTDEITSYDTPVLKNKYLVTYDTNLPAGCDDNTVIDSEEYGAFNNVTIKDIKLSCDGYLFKGFKPADDDLDYINEDVFMMPRHDVNIKGVWTKLSIEKSMDGTVFDSNHYLNEVLKDEYKNGSLALLYTGEHQDTIAGVGEEPIYYYSLTNDTKKLAASNKNNVVFAGHCWQILRTTDTGGVKLLYNGEVDTDGTCGITRPQHLVKYNYFDISTSRYDYYYSSSYSYDVDTKKFKLGSDSKAISVNESNKDSLIGKYTCFSTSNSTCSTISEVKSVTPGDDGRYDIMTHDYTYANYSFIATTEFNRLINGYGSFIAHGYMNNKEYNISTTSLREIQKMYEEVRFSSSLKYSDSYEYDGSNYTLSEPILTGASSASDLVNKYVLNGNTMYYVLTSTGSYLNSIKVEDMNDRVYYGTSYIDNNDGTYTLVDYDYVTKKDYYKSYSDFINKYICFDSHICSDISRATDVFNVNYRYVSPSQTIMYADDYIYEDGIYKLSGNTKLVWDVDAKNFSDEVQNKKYTCLNITGECENINYITSIESSNTITNVSVYYATLSNGEGINELLDESYNSSELNKNNSSIKSIIDEWYENELLEYTDYIEDVIYCNDRSLLENHILSESQNVSDGGDLFDYNKQTLKCSRNLDSFSVSNEQAKLKYPIGLLTLPEVKNNVLSDINNNFWLSTPTGYYTQFFTMFLANQKNTNVRNPRSVRPTITLKSDTLIDSGTGSMDDPYTIVYYE